jgi:NADH-quinone oxidoreductase subunit J
MPNHLFYDIVFAAATALAIGSALGVVLSGNPFHSALSLLLNLVSLATFYLLLQADFLAAAQVIVYAGAVMIMFMFVTAYLGGRADEPTASRPLWQTGAAFVAAIALVVEVIFAVGHESFPQGAAVSGAFGGPLNIGTSLLGRYLLAFETTSIMLMVAAIGGVVLGSRKAAPRQPGELGSLEDAPVQALPRTVQSQVMDIETRFEVGTAVGAPDEDEKT